MVGGRAACPGDPAQSQELLDLRWTLGSSPRVTATFHFELVSPEKIAFSGDVDQVDVPGTEGDFGVLAGHAPLISLLRPGW